MQTLIASTLGVEGIKGLLGLSLDIEKLRGTRQNLQLAALIAAIEACAGTCTPSAPRNSQTQFGIDGLKPAAGILGTTVSEIVLALASSPSASDPILDILAASPAETIPVGGKTHSLSTHQLSLISGSQFTSHSSVFLQ